MDQINMRLLPKLSGTELTASQRGASATSRSSAGISSTTPNSPSAVKEAQSHAQLSQIFTWPGYTYE